MVADAGTEPTDQEGAGQAAQPDPSASDAAIAGGASSKDQTTGQLSASGLLEPVTPEQRAIFVGSPEEPPPEARFDDRHYVHSNEQHHEYFYPYVEAVGRGYIGVASEQNYTIAARARSEWLWLMDYDIVIVHLHRSVHALVAASPDAASYQALWAKDRKDEAIDIIEKAWADDPALADIVKIFERYRGVVHDYNETVLSRAAAGDCAFWLHDEGSYDWIRQLVLAGRVRSLRGNLLENVTMQGIAKAARALGTTIRVIYLSDAESFFMYKQAWRDNFSAQPFDDRSVIVRTVSGKVFDMPKGDYQWHYNVQSAQHFVGQLTGEKPIPKVYGAVKASKPTSIEGLGVTGIEPRPAATLPVKALAPAAAPAATLPASVAPAATAPAGPSASIKWDGAGSPGVPAKTASLPTNVPVTGPPLEPQTAPATDTPPDLASCGDVPDGMACVPGGWFLRGADDADPDRKPGAKVWVSTFWMDRYEVTNQQFDECIKAGGCKKHEHYKGFGGPLQPAVGIDWFNAHSFCEWAHERLPTEAEWEKAARGSSGALYPWGNEPPTCSLAHYRGCLPETTLDVGSLPAGFWGIFDMAGNGYEWVQDWWSPCYEGCDNECGKDCTGPDPRGPCGGEGSSCPGFARLKVLRGGSWYWPEAQVASSWRRAYKQSSGEHRLSVRCALGPPAA